MIASIVDEETSSSSNETTKRRQHNCDIMASSIGSAADNGSSLCDAQGDDDSREEEPGQNADGGSTDKLPDRKHTSILPLLLRKLVRVGLPAASISLGLFKTYTGLAQRASNSAPLDYSDKRVNRNLRNFAGNNGNDEKNNIVSGYVIAVVLCAVLLFVWAGCTYCRERSQRNTSEWRQKHKGSLSKKVSMDRKKLRKYSIYGQKPKTEQTGNHRTRQNPVQAAASANTSHRSLRVKELSNSPFYAGRASIHGGPGKKPVGSGGISRAREVQSTRGIREEDNASSRGKSRRHSNSVPTKSKRYSQSQLSTRIVSPPVKDTGNPGHSATATDECKPTDQHHTMQQSKRSIPPAPPRSTRHVTDDASRNNTGEQGNRPFDAERAPAKEPETHEEEPSATPYYTYPSSIDSEMSTATDNTLQDCDDGGGRDYSHMNGSQPLSERAPHDHPPAALPNSGANTIRSSQGMDDGGNKVQGSNEEDLAPPVPPANTDTWKAAFGHATPRTSRRKKFGSDNPLVEQQRKLQAQREAREKKKISSRLQQQMERFEGARAPSRPPPAAPDRGHSAPSKTVGTTKAAASTPQPQTRSPSATTPGGVAPSSSFTFFLQAKGPPPAVGRGRGGRGRPPTTPR
eukprot:gb/GECG01014403.1/.p1 GENE.gb/GECG01014403.1/~~gb/GECG01014403.1/.p1  ORF type:complete len:629 (+),score=83.13 gb/GECG01014403.1/:1-1887(+)